MAFHDFETLNISPIFSKVLEVFSEISKDFQKLPGAYEMQVAWSLCVGCLEPESLQRQEPIKSKVPGFTPVGVVYNNMLRVRVLSPIWMGFWA